MSIDYQSIGRNIKSQRKACGYTQEQLSEMLSVTVGYVSQMERGIAKANLDMLAQIATALHCDITLLITGVATQHENYLLKEFSQRWPELNQSQRRIVLDLMDSLLKNG